MIIATSDVVTGLGLTPGFVDSDTDTLWFDIDFLEKGSVAIVTYSFGMAPDVYRMVQILIKCRISIVEDF